MIIKKLEFKNINSYGNNLQTLEFDSNGGLILLTGKNGQGKCVSPDTQIIIEFNDEETKKSFINFLEKRKKPL